MLASFSTLEVDRGLSSTWSWWGPSYHTYLKLRPGSDIVEVEALLREMPSRYVGDEESGSGYRQFLYLQPLEDIHLNSHYRYELGDNSQRQYVAVFAAVAFFILLIACVNFMNLATARSAERAKEVGLRKAVGAGKGQLISQFLGESVVITLFALLASLLLIQLLLPYFNAVALKSLTLNYIERWPLAIGLVFGAIGVGVLAGLYPAFALSSFKPVDALKEQSSPGSTSSWLRQSLVVFQFAISVTLIIGSVIAQRQLTFMQSSDLGFDKEQMLVINSRNAGAFTDQLETFKESISTIAGVGDASLSASIPGHSSNMNTNVADRRRGQTEDGQTFYFLAVDHDFVDTYGLDIISGRGFSREFGADGSAAFILNEAAYQALGWTDANEPVGQELTRQFGDSRNIIGVVRNFNFPSLQFAVEPLVLFIDPDRFVYTSVKVAGENIESTIASLEQAWERYVPERPFEYFFLDEDFDSQYRAEIRISSMLNIFTLLAVGIACMGLFALASFVTTRRRKEIGVRKVLGASVTQIVVMLSYSFSKPVLIAALIAVPISWVLANQWLTMFANRISVGWDIFVFAILLSLLVALVTVASQSIRAARRNPVISIRSE